MNELLQAIRADLTSRRLLPLLAVLGVALLGAIGYVALGGGGEAKPPAPVASAPSPSGLPVAIAPPNATAAASETPAGARYQTKSHTRDPFVPLAGARAATTPTTSASNAASSRPASGGSPGSGSTGAGSTGGQTTTAPRSTAPKPTQPKSSKPKSPAQLTPRPLPFFSVAALFGLAPADPSEQPTLTPFENLRQFEPLPSAKAPLIVFLGVTKTGEQGRFALVVPPILRGPATCLPSTTQCQAVDLAAGQSEEFEYVKSDGRTVAFELKLVKITRRTSATGASLRALRRSHAGLRALRRAGLLAGLRALPGLRAAPRL